MICLLYLVPDLQSDDVIGDEAEEPDESLLDVVDAGEEDVPVAAHLGEVGRVRQQAAHKHFGVALVHGLEPTGNVPV